MSFLGSLGANSGAPPFSPQLGFLRSMWSASLAPALCQEEPAWAAAAAGSRLPGRWCRAKALLRLPCGAPGAGAWQVQAWHPLGRNWRLRLSRGHVPATPGEDVWADPEGLLFGTDKSGEFFDLTVSQDSGHL